LQSEKEKAVMALAIMEEQEDDFESSTPKKETGMTFIYRPN
jgi:hypothetical protein